ncbi:MAG: hypothetical protein JNL62_22940, partial [Bryobacterales bacterium]|nr:hypothetical protein [Bryobacterales bacterium]
QSQPRGSADFILAKVTPAGNDFEYCTYLGGTKFERPGALAIDSAGAAYLIGTTESSDIATTAGAIQPSSQGGNDAFIAKVNPSGDRL